MAREYRHIKQYEKEILALRESGLTYREIGEQLGFDKTRIKEFFKRENRKKRKIEAGQAVSKRGRPCKNEWSVPPSIQKLDKLTQMRYVMASKDRYIRQLEMELELVRDFLSLGERR